MSSINVDIDELSEEFTVTCTYTNTGGTGDDPDTASLSINYFESADEYPSTVTASFSDSSTSPSTSTVDGDTVSTFTYVVDYTDFGFDSYIEDGAYSFTTSFTNSGIELDETNVETFNDYDARKKIVFDSIDLGDKLESNNVNKRDYYKNEVLQAMLKSANYCASSSLLEKALRILDYLKKVTKYW